MKQLIEFTPVFDPATGTLNFTQMGIFESNKLYGVINVTRNQILYSPGATGLGGTFTDAILTLDVDTSTYDTADQLNVYYEVDVNERILEVLEHIHVSLDAILNESYLHTFILADGLNIGRRDLEDLRNTVDLHTKD